MENALITPMQVGEIGRNNIDPLRGSTEKTLSNLWVKRTAIGVESFQAS